MPDVTLPASTVDYLLAQATASMEIADLDAQDHKHLAIVKAAMAHPDYELPLQQHERPSWQGRFTEQTRQILERALPRALSLGHNYIGPEHLLLAFLDTASGALGALHDQGIDDDRLRQALVTGNTRNEGRDA